MKMLKNLCHLFCNYKRALGGDNITLWKKGIKVLFFLLIQ